MRAMIIRRRRRLCFWFHSFTHSLPSSVSVSKDYALEKLQIADFFFQVTVINFECICRKSADLSADSSSD